VCGNLRIKKERKYEKKKKQNTSLLQFNDEHAVKDKTLFQLSFVVLWHFAKNLFRS